ncbi:MAG: methyl-accepting chemotaxis protein [Deferribacteres bacterium]|nr:methyl-accepting chemotaxis protein [Deferribacteres bacterium]
MNSRVNINTHDEIEDLGETFNLMAENLQKLMEEVHSAKANVEKQVEEAVAKAENERHYLATSVDGLLAHINRFAQGDLTTTMRFQDRGDIISNLFHGINNAIAQTHNAMLKVTEVVKAVSGAVGTITVNTEELTSGASQQAMQTLEVSSAIEEMSNTISENATNALAASKIAEQSGSRATAGGKTVAEAIKEINKIAEVVNKSAQTVQSLNNSSTQIGDIIEVINEIADQTNLLALNAAIEAARAGEQGRGFTVVADEVRKLSERTTYSTQEIANKIQQMQNDTQSAVDAMHHATEEVNQGKSLIDQAGVSLNEIINDSENVIEVIAQVATASEEQASTSTQISQNVDAIHTITQRQSENSQKIADLTKELNILMTELNNVVDNFQLDAASIPVSGDFISQGSRVKDMQNTNSKKETFVFD